MKQVFVTVFQSSPQGISEDKSIQMSEQCVYVCVCVCKLCKLLVYYVTFVFSVTVLSITVL